jgi:hypothetical protein
LLTFNNVFRQKLQLEYIVFAPFKTKLKYPSGSKVVNVVSKCLPFKLQYSISSKSPNPLGLFEKSNITKDRKHNFSHGLLIK